VRRLLAVLPCAVMVFTATGTVASAAACPAVQYIDSLRRVDAALSSTPPDVAAATTQLRAVMQTYASATQTLEPALVDLQAPSPDVADAHSTLDADIRAIALPAGAVCNTDLQPAHAALHQVYASPVFAGLDHNQQLSLLDEIGQWIASLFQRAGRALGPTGSILLGAVVLAAVLALAAWRLRGMLGAKAARLREEPAGDTDDPGREWSLAGRAAARGEYREAIRRAFRSALLDVLRRGRLPVDPSWTTHELLGAARADPALLAALAPAADSFDHAWYSGEPVGAGDWELARNRCAAVRTAARSRVPQEQA
jgi:hypothetical protein